MEVFEFTAPDTNCCEYILYRLLVSFHQCSHVFKDLHIPQSTKVRSYNRGDERIFNLLEVCGLIIQKHFVLENQQQDSDLCLFCFRILYVPQNEQLDLLSNVENGWSMAEEYCFNYG